MNPGFFKSLWRLIHSQLESFSSENQDKAKKLLKDLFSTTFGKSVEYAEEEEKRSMASLLRDRATDLSSTAEPSEINQMISKAILILAESLEGSVSDSICDEFTKTVFSLNDDEIFNSLTSPVLNRVLSGYFASVDDFINQVESRVIVPLLARADPEEEYKKSLLLTSCPTLVASIETAMTQAIRDMTEWCHAESKSGSDIELTFFALLNSGKIGLFRQLPKTDASTALREKFLTTLGISLRLAQSTSALPTSVEVQKKFFFIPKVGIVMDRWLDKELKKYNDMVVSRMTDLVAQKKTKKIEELRGLIRGCFINPSSIVTLPFGQNIDSVVEKFLESEFTDITVLPCALTSETIRKIVSSPIGGGYFQFDDMHADKMKLTDLGASAKLAIAAAVVSQPVVSAEDGTEDLIDILLRELLQRLPEHAFLHRSHPVKVQPGVYRFGAREVTFHTKGGSLFVYRVGDYVSESDGVEFVAREFGVPVTRLKSTTAASAVVSGTGAPNFEGPSRFHEEARRPASSITAGMRRPMDWDNDELMFRIVRRGLKAGDRIWREGWYNFCRQEGVSQDPRAQKKDSLAKFLELNMAHAARQEWANNLLYYIRDDDVSFPPLSDGEGEELKGRQTTQTSTVSGPLVAGRTGVSPADHPNYKTRLCMMFQQGRCTRGAGCGFAHGESELRAGASGTVNVSSTPAQFYKTRMCNAFLEGRCTRGSTCSYAHSEAERVASASGVPRRDMKITEDLRLAEKRKAMMYNGRSPSPVPASKSQRTSRHDDSSKPLPYMAPARSAGRREGGRVDENEL